jgi:hypothetical protein
LESFVNADTQRAAQTAKAVPAKKPATEAAAARG